MKLFLKNNTATYSNRMYFEIYDEMRGIGLNKSIYPNEESSISTYISLITLLKNSAVAHEYKCKRENCATNLAFNFPWDHRFNRYAIEIGKIVNNDKTYKVPKIPAKENVCKSIDNRESSIPIVVILSILACLALIVCSICFVVYRKNRHEYTATAAV